MRASSSRALAVSSAARNRPGPGQQRVRGGVVRRDHHDAPAPPGPDPVLGHAQRLRGARAGRVHLRVGAAGADQFGELRVPHGQGAEQEAAVEGIRLRLQLVPKFGDAPVYLGHGRILRGHPGADVLQRAEFAPAGTVFVVAVEIRSERPVTGERGREDDSGVVAHAGRQQPAVRQPGAERRGVVMQHQRDAGVAQRVDAGADGQPGALVERGVPVRVDPELPGQVEGPVPAGQLDDVALAVDRLEDRGAGVALHQPGDVLIGHLTPHLARDHVDELLAGQDARDVLIVEDPLGAGQAERGAGDDHRLGLRQRRGVRRRGRRRGRPGGGDVSSRRVGGEDRAAAVDEIGDQAAESGVTVLRHGCSWCGR